MRQEYSRQVTDISDHFKQCYSVLCSLLVRLYEPDSGQIRVDGVELARLDPTFLRRYIGTVPQEPVLFCDTVRNNILYGRWALTYIN